MANDLITGLKEEAASLLPPTMGLSKDIPVEKMKSALVVAANKNPALLTADRTTLWQSVRQCAADGLLPDGREAALVIFKTKKGEAWIDAVQYIPMVFGLRKRALNSGEVKDIRSYLVYRGEWESGRFIYLAGDEEKIEHRPILPGLPGEPERGPVIGAYAVAVQKDGSYVRQWLDLEAIEKRRRSAPSQRIYEKGKPPRVSDEPIGVWKEWWEEKALVTVVRSISKKLSLSSDDLRLIQGSEYDFDVQEPEAPKKTLIERLKEAKQETPSETPHDPETGEVAEQGEGAATEGDALPEYDETLAAPMDQEFDEGAKAFKAKKKMDANPYKTNPAFSQWLAGYLGAKGAAG